ncbi:DNA cytosine methyltransferase [Christiangramia fulva]|uniref:DNA cytosine methyltransferase n=1 Tax=Christiangramia fulva TaxID=2126553 RepID=UPI00131B18F4|nr:DNA (cytosine-5-)-methyltransferase [Christiangramia fulva]
MSKNNLSVDRKYIELFAGCGGLSLGLESAGWKLDLANEISPMAGETFAYNILGENITQKKDGTESKVCNVNDLHSINIDEWKGKKLVIGDVVRLVDTLRQNPKLSKRFKNIDLVSGGPPCQGFSMAGRRTERDPKNRLPYAFVDFVELIKPKTVILENVEGILRPFKSEGGTKEPWLEIAKAFASIGYAPLCFLINARNFKIPQNRPRFIMLGIHKSLKKRTLSKLSDNLNSEIKRVFEHAFIFAEKDREFISNYNGHDPAVHIDVIKNDFAKNRNLPLKEIFNSHNLFPEMNSREVSVKAAIEDLSNNAGIRETKNKELLIKSSEGSEYSNFLSRSLSKVLRHPQTHVKGLYNHELRKHSSKIVKRFTFLQEIKKLNDAKSRTIFESCLRGKEVSEEDLEKARLELAKSTRLREVIDFSSSANLKSSIEMIRSKKHSQRAIKEDEPAPAQVTIPDDICHYSDKQPRVLTVREMARIQSFPDDFVFRAKVTTGGGIEKQKYLNTRKLVMLYPHCLVKQLELG